MHKNNLVNTFCARRNSLFRMLRAFSVLQFSRTIHQPYTEKLGSYKIVASVISIFVAGLILLQPNATPTAQATALATETNTDTLRATKLQTEQVEQVESAANAPFKPLPLAKPVTSHDDNVPGEIIVIFHPNVNRSAPLEVTSLIENTSVSVIEELDLSGLDTFLSVDGSADDRAGNGNSPPFQPGQLIRVPIGSEADVLAQLNQNPAVAFAIPNGIVRASGAPVQPMQSVPSHVLVQKNSVPHLQKQRWDKTFLGNYNQTAATVQTGSPAHDDSYEVNDPYYSGQWYMGRIQMIKAWAFALHADGSANQMSPVKVAVIDSGIDYQHPEFAGRVVDGENYFALGTDAVDDYGHGTHVSGLIGASVNNGIGIAGVAPWVQIMPYKTLDAAGNGTISNVTQAIRDATDAGAQIINMSLETGAPDMLMQAAIDYAESKNVVLIASVGNLAPLSVRWPAAYPEVIGVAGTDSEDQHTDYSCTGIEVEIAAPGGTYDMPMRSTWSSLADCPGVDEVDPAIGAYCYARGTSMSTGLVSGAAAIILGVQPDLTAEEVRALLIDSALPLLSQSPEQIGNGLLNAHDAARLSVTSDLQVRSSTNIQTLEEDSLPYSVVITASNPSLAPITWQATWSAREWLTITTPFSGVIQYGAPSILEFTVTPTDLTPDIYNSIVTIIGTKVDGSRITARLAINVTIEDPNTNRPSPTWTPPPPTATTPPPTATVTPTPTATFTPTPVPTPTKKPEATATSVPPGGSNLALDINYNTTELMLKRSDEPYELIVTINNDESESVSWQLSLAPTDSPGTEWSATPIIGTISPNESNKVILIIDPLRLPVGVYATELIVSAQGDTSTRPQFIATDVSLTIQEGLFEIMLPAIIR